MKTAEEIFFEEIDEVISSNFSDCSSLVEVIDGFGGFKLNEDKANWIRNLIIRALGKAYNKALEDLEGVEIINPKLVNDGFGEFPDVYQLTGANVLQIKEKLKK